LASAAVGAGAADTAARLWGAVETIESTIGVRMLSSERGRYELALGDLDPRLLEEGHALDLDPATALALELQTRLAAVDGSPTALRADPTRGTDSQ
jgi:hypothetical protein